MAGWGTNGVPQVGTANYPQVLGYELNDLDTSLAGGVFPQSVAASTFYQAALYFALANSTASATSGAATLNTVAGTITSESLSTAAGATYTLTLTNSKVAATSAVQAAAYLKSSTAGGPLVVTSIVPAAGSVVIKVQNTGTAAVSGTIAVLFQVANAI